MATRRHPLGWTPYTRHEPPIVTERMDRFCAPPNQRVKEHETAAAQYLWVELPTALQELVRAAVFGNDEAQAEVAARMKLLRERWPQFCEHGAA